MIFKPSLLAAVAALASMTALAETAHAQTAATVTVNPAAPGAPVTNLILGMNMANWQPQTLAAIPKALKSAGIAATRWPGGSISDIYHRSTNTECGGGYVAQGATFDDFVHDVVVPDKLDLAVTVNYGTNAACNAGGVATEAAAWVTYAKSKGYTVSHWTVGNENYGSWETDLHKAKNDATTYAKAVATGFYPAMKAADANALVGVPVEPGWSPAWDPIVLSHAKYDFVEYHFYAQEPGSESDTYLVNQAARDFATQLSTIKSELATAGHSETPIYVGELGSVSYNPGKQTSSITQALFAGQALGEMMNAGISRATWWLGFGGCADASSGNFASSLYGWQNFGGYMVFSDGTPEDGCPNATTTKIGTLLPTARAFALFALVAHQGERALGTSLSGSSANVRAYALTQNGGTALVLFNLNPSAPIRMTVAVTGINAASAVTLDTYDKAIYDKSQTNVWAAAQETKLGAKALPFALNLAPWSMNVLRLAK